MPVCYNCLLDTSLYDAEYDYDNFADFAVGMSISKETSKKYKPIIHRFAKFLNHLTFGKVWHFVRLSSGVSKSEISKISSKKVVPFVINIAAVSYTHLDVYKRQKLLRRMEIKNQIKIIEWS